MVLGVARCMPRGENSSLGAKERGYDVMGFFAIRTLQVTLVSMTCIKDENAISR